MKTKLINGKILVFLGTSHTLLAITPFAFGKQFSNFSESLFFKISDGLTEFPILNGTMNYENFSAFWFFYFGILLIPLGLIVSYVEKETKNIPLKFSTTYLLVVLLGVYMIPFSGMTILMLPHSVYMLYQSIRLNKSLKI